MWEIIVNFACTNWTPVYSEHKTGPKKVQLRQVSLYLYMYLHCTNAVCSEVDCWLVNIQQQIFHAHSGQQHDEQSITIITEMREGWKNQITIDCHCQLVVYILLWNNLNLCIPIFVICSQKT